MNRATTGMGRLTTAIAACTVLCGSEDTCSSPHSVRSTDVATDEIFVDITARATGNGMTRIRMTMDLGNPLEDVDLNGGDRLVATHVDPTTLKERAKVLMKHENFDDFAYGGAFRTQEKDDIIEVALDRSATGWVSANDSSVTIPTPFVLDWVDDPVAMGPAPETFSRSSTTPYFVIWDPFDAPDFEPGDELRYAVTGNCIQPFFGVIDWQSGEDALQLTGVLQDRAAPRDGQSCRIHVELTLRRIGTVDPAFAGGSFGGERVRVLNLVSTP